MRVYVRGKMISISGKDVDLTDATAVTNLLHSLFTQCPVMLNGDPFTPSPILPILKISCPTAQMLPYHIF